MPAVRESVRRGRPSSYEREQLIAVAKRIGPDRLSLTVVANELGVPRTTLYNALRGPGSLGQVVLSSILSGSGSALPKPPIGEPWLAQLEAFAHRERAALLAAGPWLRFYEPSIHLTNDQLHMADQLIGAMIDDGVPTVFAGQALALVTQVVQQSIMDYLRLPLGEANGSGAVIERLDPHQYPSLTAARSAFESEARGEAQYQFSLKCALVGIATLAGHDI